MGSLFSESSPGAENAARGTQYSDDGGAAWLSTEESSNWMWAVGEWMRSACSKADVQVSEELHRKAVVR